MYRCFVCLLTMVGICASVAQASRPSKVYDRTPAAVQLAYDSLNITTTNRTRLTAWLCKPAKQQSDALVIVAGPDAGNMADQLDYAAGIVSQLGMRVLLFDYEGFGTSSPLAIDTDAIAMPEFADDLHRVLLYSAAHIQTDTNRIVLYGRSMGASLAMSVAALDGGCGGVVAESPYTSQSSLATACNTLYEKTARKRETHTIASQMLEPMETASRLRKRLLLIHGGEEDLISSAQIEALYDKCSSKKKSLWIAAGARHLEVPYNEMGTFLNAFFSLVNNLEK